MFTINFPFSGVSVDSRVVKPGHLFFALDGAKSDGHFFLEEAAKLGAAGAVVHRDYKGNDFGLPLIYVENSLKALQRLAKETLEKREVKIVAITGSVGKTTTKEFLVTLLKQKYRVGFSPGNYNSQVGLPLAILNHTQGDEEILIFEMGMTESGQIAELIQIAPPDIAVITSVALVHACNFNSLGDIALAKAEIFLHPKTQIGILDGKIENLSKIMRLGTCRKSLFSLACEGMDYYLKPTTGQDFIIQMKNGEEQNLGLFQLPGKHNRHNLLAAIACARNLGLGWDEIKQGMSSLKLPEKRFEIKEVGGILFVNDSYNASTISMKAALESLPDGKRKIAVLGDMLELGKFSSECHREVALKALNYLDILFCFGRESQVMVDIWKEAGKPIFWFENKEALAEILYQKLQPGDVVLIKASRGMMSWKILEEYVKTK